ncbi:MAG: hypothetical protein CUN52_02900 [Phototrophicales bacterium]|nr:MAG: hypothetical protein CUN52_02900 [Phototrophicales bacterium]
MRWFWLFLLFTTHISISQPFTGDSDYFIEVLVNNTNPFVGEQITYVIRYYTINQNHITLQFPNFEGFWIGEANTLPTIIRNIGDNQYFVSEIQINIAPLRAGDIWIDETRLVVIGDVFRSQQIISSARLNLSVRALPSNAPDSFLGAVGEFVMSANFDATLLTLGNPFRFTIDIQGVGILDTIIPPELNFPDDWRISAQSPRYIQPNIGLPLGIKRFEWVVIPATIGTYIIQPIQWAYFDPNLAEYMVLSTPSFTLDISPSNNGDVRLSTFQSNIINQLPLKADAPNALWLRGDWWRIGWVIMPLITMSMVMIAGYRKRKVKHDAQMRYKKALARARKRLKGIYHQPTSAKMSAVIYAYIADKHNTTPKIVSNNLHEYIPNIDHLKRIEALLSQIEGALYLPEGVRYDFAPVFTEMEQILSILEKSWE